MMYRNRKLLDLAKQATHCTNCGRFNDGTIVAAHSNQLRDGKGKNLKAHDYRIAFLCSKCHHELDQGKQYDKKTKFKLWDEAHRKTIGFLFENNFLKVVS